MTALHRASKNGHADIVTLLIEHKADVNVGDDDHWTALHYATMMGHARIVINDGGISAYGIYTVVDVWERALILSSQKGHCHIVSLLIAHKANVNACTIHGVTALMTALVEGHIECARLLVLADGIDVNAMSDRGHTALSLAALKGYARMVALLIKYKADVNAVATRSDGLLFLGYTALMHASQQGHVECVRVLLANGADRYLRAPNGKTAAQLATDERVLRELKK
ncbi:unnamed protein product [Sphagnum balticum]